MARLRTVPQRLAAINPKVSRLAPDRQAARELPTNSAKWRRIRESVLLRDHYTCRCCGRMVAGKGRLMLTMWTATVATTLQTAATGRPSVCRATAQRRRARMAGSGTSGADGLWISGRGIKSFDPFSARYAHPPTHGKIPLRKGNQQMAGVKGKSGGPRKNAGGARPGAGRKPKQPVPVPAKKSANTKVSAVKVSLEAQPGGGA